MEFQSSYWLARSLSNISKMEMTSNLEIHIFPHKFSIVMGKFAFSKCNGKFMVKMGFSKFNLQEILGGNPESN